MKGDQHQAFLSVLPSIDAVHPSIDAVLPSIDSGSKTMSPNARLLLGTHPSVVPTLAQWGYHSFLVSCFRV